MSPLQKFVAYEPTTLAFLALNRSNKLIDLQTPQRTTMWRPPSLLYDLSLSGYSKFFVLLVAKHSANMDPSFNAIRWSKQNLVFSLP